MFDKIKNFVTDPENLAIAKNALISLAVTAAVTCAIQVVAIGAGAAVQAISNKIEESKEEE